MSIVVPLERLASRTNVAKRRALVPRPLTDALDRPLTDLRLSVTDRCNFRCQYCMPRSKVGPVTALSSRSRLLDFDELYWLAKAFVALGVTKIRITGGEPLLRRDLAFLVERLASLGVDDLCMTTNGSLLSHHAQVLANAGLRRVTVSLDAIDESTFRRITDGHTPLSTILTGIDAARDAGLHPVKVNMVVQRGVNEHAILPMVRWARREGLELRLIEYMDVGSCNGWSRRYVVPSSEVKSLIHREFPLEPMLPRSREDTAERFRFLDGYGHVGTIASITRPFCGNCTRARISSQGQFYPCLFSPWGTDLATPLREGRPLRPIITELWQRRSDRYSELRSEVTKDQARPEMSQIGG